MGIKAADRLGKELVDYIAREPQQNIPRMLEIGLALARLPDHKQKILELKRLYETNDVYRQAFLRLASGTCPQVRKRLM